MVLLNYKLAPYFGWLQLKTLILTLAMTHVQHSLQISPCDGQESYIMGAGWCTAPYFGNCCAIARVGKLVQEVIIVHLVFFDTLYASLSNPRLVVETGVILFHMMASRIFTIVYIIVISL